MPARAFAYQWSQRTWKDRIASYDGLPVPYCGSNQFPRVRLAPGDDLYVLALGEGRESLLVIGRFTIAARAEALGDASARGAVLSPWEARQVLGDGAYGVPLYEAASYVVPRPGSATAMHFDREVPLERPVRFIGADGSVMPLCLDPDGTINRQAIRSVRRLHATTVDVLDEVLAA